ncbi:hypothetical protein Syun_000309 [Stephania yunnanensis]|uniref:Alpha 1,4-glycosyltransferase domain-containing protein n=1 Tax=Stephania yunnanensis TaxID=152371 RepID=A0AAP0LHA8_9MAGN
MLSSSRTNGHAKSSMLSALPFACVMLLVLLFIGTIYCSFSFTLITAFKDKVMMKTTRQYIVKPTYTELHGKSRLINTLLSVEEETTEVVNYSEGPDTLVCPLNMSAEERKTWIKEKSTALSKQFERRADKFLNGGYCEAQFFMTWIAPVESFGKREFVTLETLFKAHPKGCLMILSRSMDSKHGKHILKPLIERGFKATALAPDLSFLLKKTPAEAWLAEMKEGKRDPGEISLAQNLSNLLRLAVLYKYGGIYLDTDFIVLKKLSDLQNSIGAQSMDTKSNSWNRLNNAILIFDKGHPILFKFLEGFSRNFDGNRWGHNGPHLLTRVVKKMGERLDHNMTILPSFAFYPVDWKKIFEFFRKPSNEAERTRKAASLLQLNNATYSLHLWNKETSKTKIEEGSIIDHLISDHCILCMPTYA